jgi:hypothetical protein
MLLHRLLGREIQDSIPVEVGMMFDPVLLSIVRKTMPNIIARDIIGVSPMRGPIIDDIFNRPRIKMSKAQYKQFLRLNDRKGHQHENDFLKAKYPYHDKPNSYITTSDRSIVDWLDMNMPDRYVYMSGWTPRIFFENEQLKILFLLRWS